MKPSQNSQSSSKVGRILAVVSLCVISTGCNTLFSEPAPLPGWRSPIDYLFLTMEDLPGMTLSSPKYISEPDKTINTSSRKFHKFDSTISVYQIIWRSYTINDAQEHYLDRRKNEFLTPQPPIPDSYCEFKPPEEITLKSQVADEFYLACGTWYLSQCKVLARYRNYVTELQIDKETECNGEHHEGLTYATIEQIIKAMDSHFEEFLRENPLETK